MKHAHRRNGIAGVAIAAVACVAAVVWAQNGRTRVSAEAHPSTAAAAHPIGVDQAAVAARKPVQYYTSSVRADLFGSAEAPPALTPVVVAKTVSPVAVPKPDDPLIDYAYSGTLTFGDRVVALIENKKTRTGQYLTEGEPFLGGAIGHVTTDAVVVRIAGIDRNLGKTTDFRLTPLDRNAPAPTASALTPNATMPAGPNGAQPVAPQAFSVNAPTYSSPSDDNRQGSQGRGQRRRGQGGRGTGAGLGGTMGGDPSQ